MKKFLKHIVIFAAILFVIAGGIDVFITHKLHQLESSPFANWNDIYRTEINSDVLIMGSSRAYVQINPQIIDSILNVNSYNLGANGRLVDAQILKYHVFRQKQNVVPKLIIYEVHAGTMDISNKYERIQYTPYLYDPYLWLLTHQHEDFTIADGIIPLWRYLDYNTEIMSIMRNESAYCKDKYKLAKGFRGNDKEWNGEEFKKRKTISYNKNPEAMQLFDDFLAECKQENIKVVLVMAPYYIGATKKVKDYAGMQKMFSGYAEKYDYGFLDYTYDSISYDTTYFYNAMHLNRTGATLFSEKLAHDIDSLNVLK